MFLIHLVHARYPFDIQGRRWPECAWHVWYIRSHCACCMGRMVVFVWSICSFLVLNMLSMYVVLLFYWFHSRTYISVERTITNSGHQRTVLTQDHLRLTDSVDSGSIRINWQCWHWIDGINGRCWYLIDEDQQTVLTIDQWVSTDCANTGSIGDQRTQDR